MKYILQLLVFLLCLSAATAQDGNVVLYRPSRFGGGGRTPSVCVDEKPTVRLHNGRYVPLHLAIGKHAFKPCRSNALPLEVGVKAGETAYVEMVVARSKLRGTWGLTSVGEAEAKPAVAKLKPLEAKWVTVPDVISKPAP